MRARSYHASPGEVRSVGGCPRGVWMNGADTLDDGAMPEGIPAEPRRPHPAVTSTNAVDWVDMGEDPEGITSVPVPDSYPHVTCGGWSRVGVRRASSRSRRRHRRRGGFCHHRDVAVRRGQADQADAVPGRAATDGSQMGHCAIRHIAEAELALGGVPAADQQHWPSSEEDIAPSGRTPFLPSLHGAWPGRRPDEDLPRT